MKHRDRLQQMSTFYSWGGTCQLLAAILNFAAIAHQDGVPTCSQWFLKIS